MYALLLAWFAITSAEVIDLNQPSPTWRSVAPMSIARRQVNATLLPDGTVLVTGGTSGPGFNNATTPVYPAELWDPATNLWREVAPVSSARAFARLVVAHRGIYQVSGVGSDEHADPTVERFVWR